MAAEMIPVVDLSPFFNLNGTQESKTKVIKTINQACRDYGFFQIVNHTLSEELITKALKLSHTFFNYPDDEKLKFKPTGSPCLGQRVPAGYNKQPDHSLDKNEYLLMHPPQTGLNIYPEKPHEFREVVEEVFGQMVKTGLVVESILNECLGLPQNFLQELNLDRSWDFMVAIRYFPATMEQENGLLEHEDGNIFTFLFQDDVGGLEVLKNDKWIPIDPSPGSIVVNISDTLQVWTNNVFKSATHRVIRKKGRSRSSSYAYFFNVNGDTWIEPLPQFTSEVGELPKYQGFFNKDYLQLRMRNKTHPPANPEDVVTIKNYAINT